MLNNKTIAVIVPAYNEEKQILQVISTMPDFVDRIVVINDFSTDRTGEIVLNDIKTQTSTGDVLVVRSRPEQTKYNQAEIVLHEMGEEELQYYVPVHQRIPIPAFCHVDGHSRQ
jgi:glycosyltransferase involved in cell wall biosynthesis